ncbi:hypothetical protein BGZ63DRAFT_230772 [Mariannaea sp. PMI_226]|nr:hypothetical protein BGZ63DRAFT_230772 [Mariannaea sp. PMI_226]
MAEIVGVAASAAQLAGICFSLLDIIKKIKGGSSALKRYHQQLQELSSLSDSISKNPLLQTPEIGDQTHTILSIIQDNCLNSLLQKNRWLQTWGLFHRERDIIDIFAVLERQKASLSLAIEDIQSRALYQIQTDINIMAQNSSSSDHKALDQSPERASDQTPPTIFRSSTGWVHTSPLERTLTGLSNMIATDTQIIGQGIYQGALDKSIPHTQMPSRSEQNLPQSSAWDNCSAGNGVHQINGSAAFLRVNLGKKQSIGAGSTYTNCTKKGKGVQINGINVIDHGSNFSTDDFEAHGSWKGCHHLGVPSDGSQSSQQPNTSDDESTQLNGHTLTQIP